MIAKLKYLIYYSCMMITVKVICLFSKIKENRVLFLSDVRDHLGGNLEMMDNYIKGTKYEKVYCLKKSEKEKIGLTKWLHTIKMICTSKYVILDDFCPMISFIKVKKGQKIIQLWHGPGAYKTFGLSRNDKKAGALKKYLTHRNYTDAIVTSKEIVWCFAEAFGMEEKNVHAVGFPRTDIFFDKEYIKKVKEEFYKKYKDLKNKKIIMFAPTYRGVSLASSYYKYDEIDVDKIYKELNKDYVFIIKWHPGLNNGKAREEFNKKIEKYKDFYLDFTHYRDINDLLLVTDILVTDYSSVIFDYLLVNKPIVYFTHDLKEYEDGRGLYYKFNKYVYGEVTKTSSELIEAIKKGNMCDKAREEFRKTFMSSCDGKSTERTYNMIFK